MNLTTPLGLAVALLGRTRLRPGPSGLLLAEGYCYGFPMASAFTIGNVVLTAGTFRQLQAHLPGLLEHEAEHAKQYAWLGLSFLPLYALATGASWLTTGDRAADNPFERMAGLHAGGYRAIARRWRR